MFSSLISLAEVPQAKAAVNEEVKVRLTKGRGRFSSDKKFITLSMKMYRPDGTPDGYGAIDGEHFGVWEAQFASPEVLFARPDPPEPPMDQPVGPVQDISPSAQTKAIWTFRDGSSITAVGPAMSHLIRLDDNSHLFLVSCAQTITGGTGKYEGASGLKTSMGSTHIPVGVDLFAPGTVEFDAQTIDTFRIVRARNQKLSGYSESVTVKPSSDPSNIAVLGSVRTDEVPSAVQLHLGQEYPPPDEAKWIAEITKIHLNLMKPHPAQRGPHRKANGCAAAVFTVADDIPERYRAGIFSTPRSYLTLARFSNGGSDDDRKPDAHAMGLKLTGVSGDGLLNITGQATTQDFILCDNEVFVVTDVEQMVEFEQAKVQRAAFHGSDDEFAKANPSASFLLMRFARSGFLKLAKGSPFAAEYWSQSPSILGDGLAVKYWARPWPSNDLDRRPGNTPNYLEESMRDLLVTQGRHMYFDFLITCQADPIAMPVENPMIPWRASPQNTFVLATIDILPLPFESAAQKRFCEDLSFNPWHSIAAHRPIGGINRARKCVYATTSAARHRVSRDPSREPTPGYVQKLWNIPDQMWSAN